MSLFTLWLLTVIPALGTFFQTLAIIALITCGLAFLGWAVSLTEDPDGAFNRCTNKFKTFAMVIAIVSGLLSALIPNERGIYLILGGYYVTNTEEIRELPENVVGAANAWLKNYKEFLEEDIKDDKTGNESGRDSST